MRGRADIRCWQVANSRAQRGGPTRRRCPNSPLPHRLITMIDGRRRCWGTLLRVEEVRALRRRRGGGGRHGGGTGVESWQGGKIMASSNYQPVCAKMKVKAPDWGSEGGCLLRAKSELIGFDEGARVGGWQKTKLITRLLIGKKRTNWHVLECSPRQILLQLGTTSITLNFWFLYIIWK